VSHASSDNAITKDSITEPGWFDAHLDLAMMAVHGVDLTNPSPNLGDLRYEFGDGCITLPRLKTGRVRGCLGTIFTQGIAPGEALTEGQMYHYGDAEGAHRVGVEQLAWYHAWQGQRELAGEAGPTIELSVLMECADPIRNPAEVAWWATRGLVMVGLTWIGPGRYAGGNSVQTGLTPAGRDLVAALDAAHIIHDASHLSDASFDDLVAASNAVVCASHSNCRALLAPQGTGDRRGVLQRHLRDDQIREIARRGGVIGLNLFSAFIDPSKETRGRATLQQALDHVEHICQVAGSRTCVGLGSDTDGGFAASRLIEGIDSPSDYDALAIGLSNRGWNAAEVAGFMEDNWRRVLGARVGKLRI
jgi:membrane dipeptidase